MSSFKNFAPMLTSLQAQADGTGTLDGSAIEDFLSIAGYETPGGGGGSGDLSTASVTIDASACIPDNGYSLFGANIYDDGEYIYSEGEAVVFGGATATMLFILYKGECLVYPVDQESYTISSVQGSITLDEDGFAHVAGDGTITIADV